MPDKIHTTAVGYFRTKEDSSAVRVCTLPFQPTLNLPYAKMGT